MKKKIFWRSFKIGKRPALVIGALVAIVVSVNGYLYYSQIVERDLFYRDFQKDLNREIKRAEFRNRRSSEDLGICFSVTDANELSALVDSMRMVDTQRHGGHVKRVLGFGLVLEFEGGQQDTYLAFVFDDHPEDLFLSRSLWQVTNKGAKRSGDIPIRIPDLATWVLTEFKRRGCL